MIKMLILNTINYSTPCFVPINRFEYEGYICPRKGDLLEDGSYDFGVINSNKWTQDWPFIFYVCIGDLKVYMTPTEFFKSFNEVIYRFNFKYLVDNGYIPPL